MFAPILYGIFNKGTSILIKLVGSFSNIFPMCPYTYLLMPVITKVRFFAISPISRFPPVSLWWNHRIIYIKVHIQYGNKDIKNKDMFCKQLKYSLEGFPPQSGLLWLLR